MTMLLALLAGIAFADTDTFTATVTATATRTASATTTPTITPTPAIKVDDDFYVAPMSGANFMRLYELDRSPSLADGIGQKVYPPTTPALMWTPDPYRHVLIIQNRSCYYQLEGNTGPFSLGDAFCIEPGDTLVLGRKMACRSIWLAAPSPTVEARLWTQYE